MATIVAIEADGGAVLAGDRRETSGGTVTSDNKRHVFDFGDVGAAAVGGSDDVGSGGGGIDEFRRRLETEVESHETEHGESMNVTRLATVASDIADEEGVEAVVAGREDEEEETAKIRGIRPDGSILGDGVAAFGSGAQLALGVLEGREEGISFDDAEELARDAIDTAADRDTDTGTEIDTYRLADRD
jgi:proteasome beta subunit